MFEVDGKGRPRRSGTRGWIAAQGPAPVVEWTVEWEGVATAADGRPVAFDDVRTVTARTAHEARGLAAQSSRERRAGVTADVSLTSTRERVREAGGEWRRVDRGPLAHGDAAALRALSAAGWAPTALLDRLAPMPTRERMGALAVAWRVPMEALDAAGAYVRGELAREVADAALARVAEDNRWRWEIEHRVAEAARDDVISEALARAGRAHPIATMQALMAVLGVTLGQAKTIVGALDQEGEALTQVGTLSRVVARVRARR